MAEFDFVQVGAAAPADGGYDSQICCHQTTSDIHHFEFYKFYTDTATCKWVEPKPLEKYAKFQQIGSLGNTSLLSTTCTWA